MSQRNQMPSKRTIGLRLKTKPIVVRSNRFGRMTLRAPSLRDLAAYQQLLNEVDDPRDLTVRVIHNQLVRPELSVIEVGEWKDPLLRRTAIAWIQEPAGVATTLPETGEFYDNFRAAVAEYVADSDRRMRETLRSLSDQTLRGWSGHRLLEGLKLPTFTVPMRTNLQIMLPDLSGFASLLESRALAGVVGPKLDNAWMSRGLAQALESIAASQQSMQTTIAAMAKAAAPRIDFGRLLPRLPDLVEIARSWEELALAEGALEESGFGFTGHLWTTAFLRPLASLGSKTRRATITKKLLRYTRSDPFRQDIKQGMQSSSVLARRWPIVERGLEAHRQGDFVLAIPALLTQLEGVIGDALVLRSVAIKEGGRLYERAPDGSPRLNRRGRPIELTGLRRKLDESGFTEHEILSGLEEFMVDQLVGDRNSILHGTASSYASAKLSTQIVLALYVLVSEIAAFERVQPSNAAH